MPTVRSILELTRSHYEPWSAERAVEYYAGRLRTLARYAESIASSEALAVTYEELIDDTSGTLQRIESFLVLDQRLSANYELQPFTGKRGDPSPTIRSGTVRNPAVESGRRLPDDLLRRAAVAHRDCMTALARFLR